MSSHCKRRESTRSSPLRNADPPADGDGSRARSRLTVQFTETAREIRLLEGEALFKVEGDPARPFRVRADETVIEALGTQFNVHKRSSGTVVSVLEGVVRRR